MANNSVRWLVVAAGFWVSGMPALRAQSVATSLPAVVKTVTVRVDDVLLKDALRQIAQQAGLVAVYSAAVSQNPKRVTLYAQGIGVMEAFEKVLAGTNILASIVSGNALFGTTEDPISGNITGRVIDAKTKLPLQGARVSLDGSTNTMVTDKDGIFRIESVSVGEHRMAVRMLGYTAATRLISVRDGTATNIEVGLEARVSALDEVVVTGQVVATERRAIGTPITVITAADIQKRGITRIDQLFRGDVPGVIAQEIGSDRYKPVLGGFASSSVYSRGSASLDGAANPLKTYVDGVELADSRFLGTIDPAMIDRIEIITGPQAATIYGSGAMGGVMQIFTKKGAGTTRPEVNLSIKYGTLENSFSNAFTPAHDDGLSLTGPIGPNATYSINVTHVYSGQWQPNLFSRSLTFSLGASHMAGPVTASGTYARAQGTNGTSGDVIPGLGFVELTYNGTFDRGAGALRFLSTTESRSVTQTGAITLDYRALPFWQHQLILGQNTNDFTLFHGKPTYGTPADTFSRSRKGYGSRSSVNYNTSLVAGAGQIILTSALGFSQSQHEGFSSDACISEAMSSSAAGCTQATGTLPFVRLNKSRGGFGNWKLAFYNRVFFTFGLRAEHNSSYGRDRKIDWTPTNQLAYAIDVQDLTIKLYGSYGRATRVPGVDYRDEVWASWSTGTPARARTQLAAPLLRPERSRGPQGGVELYYGSRATLAVNYYQQTVSDLIQRVAADSFTLMLPPDYSERIPVWQYQNVATIGQKGWDGSGTVNIGPLSLRGTASWNDSRILSVNMTPNGTPAAGSLFQSVPSHFSSLSATYSRGLTSATMVVNRVGASIRTNGFNGGFWDILNYQRIKMYGDLRQMDAAFYIGVRTPGEVRADINVSHRLSQDFTASLFIRNIGNKFQSDVGLLKPTLGRQITLGLNWRALSH